MKIYFLYTAMSSFVKKDLEILRSAGEVREECTYQRLVSSVWSNIQGTLWADVLVCWFASIHFLPAVFMAKLFRRKVLVIAGGYDVVNLPAIHYGAMRGGLRAVLGRLILHSADCVISVSESNRRETQENASVHPDKNIVIYHGFAPVPEPIAPKEKMVVTVGEITWSNLKRKGLEDFVQVAQCFPEIPFKLIGRWSDDSYQHLKRIASPNVELLGFISDSDLSRVLSLAKVYVQTSRHEGFGCAVAEAMLHKCIPVVSDVFALPEVVGDCGLLVPQDGSSSLKHQIERALKADATLGEKARRRILEEFPLDKRKAAFLTVVERAMMNVPH